LHRRTGTARQGLTAATQYWGVVTMAENVIRQAYSEGFYADVVQVDLTTTH